MELRLILFLVGVLIGIFAYTPIMMFIENLNNNYNERKIKSLSKDRPAEMYKGGYIIYTKKSRFYIEAFTQQWDLYWMPFQKLDRIYNEPEMYLEFKSNWFPRWITYRLVKYTINNHPNLK